MSCKTGILLANKLISDRILFCDMQIYCRPFCFAGCKEDFCSSGQSKRIPADSATVGKREVPSVLCRRPPKSISSADQGRTGTDREEASARFRFCRGVVAVCKRFSCRFWNQIIVGRRTNGCTRPKRRTDRRPFANAKTASTWTRCALSETDATNTRVY